MLEVLRDVINGGWGERSRFLDKSVGFTSEQRFYVVTYYHYHYRYRCFYMDRMRGRIHKRETSTSEMSPDSTS